MAKCFYHSADLDGKCSAAIVKRKYPDIELIGINYGDQFPWDTLKRDESVFMVDFSLQPFEDMITLNELTNLVWIDHHASAMRESVKHDYDKKINGLRRDRIGACALCWEWFFDSKLPMAVRLLAEYDVWVHSDPFTLPFQYGMRNVSDNSPKSGIWKDLFDSDAKLVTEIMREGFTIINYQNKQNAIKASVLCFETEMDGLKLICANHGPSNSQFFDSVWDAKQHDAMCLFYWKKNQWTVSLYSTKSNVDCGEICKARDGGGHKGAAGFQCDVLPWEVKEHSNPSRSTKRRLSMKGMCCETFRLLDAPEAIWENYEHYVLNHGEYPDANERSIILDIRIIAPMLRYKGFKRRNPRGLWDPEEPGHLYTCTHLTHKGQCGIQSTKPHMCRMYSNCEFPDCESEDCRRKLLLAKAIKELFSVCGIKKQEGDKP